MDRFDLETAITNLYTIVDDLNDISYNIEQNLIEEELSHSIDSVAIVLKLKVNKLFDIFNVLLVAVLEFVIAHGILEAKILIIEPIQFKYID